MDDPTLTFGQMSYPSYLQIRIPVDGISLDPSQGSYSTIALEGEPAGFVLREDDVILVTFFDTDAGQMRAWGFIQYLRQNNIDTSPLPENVAADFREYELLFN